MTIAQDLAALSAAATPGKWLRVKRFSDAASGIISKDHGPVCDFDFFEFEDGEGQYREQDAAFIVALVNAYRAGQIVAVPDVVPPLPDSQLANGGACS